MSQSAYIINYLSAVENVTVHVHDPVVSTSAFEFEMEAQGFPANPKVKYFENDYYSAVQSCQAIVILTEWDQF